MSLFKNGSHWFSSIKGLSAIHVISAWYEDRKRAYTEAHEKAVSMIREHDTDVHMLVTAHDVRKASFSTHFGSYDTDEVDELLKKVETTLKAHENGLLSSFATTLGYHQ